MDDLNGLEWTPSSTNKSTQVPPAAARGSGNYYGSVPALSPTPPIGSRNGTPKNAQGSSYAPPKAQTKPATDSFAGLAGFGAKKETLSLKEQQEKREAEQRKAEEGRRKAGGDVFSFDHLEDDDPFGLGKMKQPATNGPAPSAAPADDFDFLGDLARPVEEIQREKEAAEAEARRKQQQSVAGQKRRMPTPQQRAPSPDSGNDRGGSDDPWDKAVNELMDMGFTAENSRRALTESGAGLNVQAAVGWLLNDAHKQAKEKAQGRSSSNAPQVRDRSQGGSGARHINGGEDESIPAWARGGESGRASASQPRRGDSRSPAISESDVAAKAAAVGANFLKSANSLWGKTQKKVARAVQDFQQEGEVDPSQPKWMRDVAAEQRKPSRHATPDAAPDMPRRPDAPSQSVTDEALALEMGTGPPPRKSARATPTPEIRGPPPSSRFLPFGSSSRDQSPGMTTTASGRSTPLPRWQQKAPSTASDARSRLTRAALEEESAQAYVSSARRKKPTPSPQPPASEEPDLLFGDGPGANRRQEIPDMRRPSPSDFSRSEQMPDFSRPQPSRPASSKPRMPTPSAPLQVRPKDVQRRIPPVDPSALAQAHAHRKTGTEHFKRGDYAAAHESYSSSLSRLPATHPLTIVLLTNHALTALKTGEPKQAVSDADAALSIIGPGQGSGEVIDIESESKDMKDFYGKALMRKAEGLENMEKWKEAGQVWKLTVESGVGGATAIQGRQRCEKALAPKPARAPTPRAAPKPKPSNGLSSLGEADSEAVIRMRKANADAEKADDEKFALSDAVDARISAWRGGREGNLRALLGAMDQVLWEGSGWKKVGLHELVVNGKVKVAYMRAIGKTHPDKLPQDASTEVKMISAAVFATLNEAWDKFKAENGM